MFDELKEVKYFNPKKNTFFYRIHPVAVLLSKSLDTLRRYLSTSLGQYILEAFLEDLIFIRNSSWKQNLVS